ncbi:hypothetical protein B0H16DRAFT_1448017 [Mycena metata]|uniref:Uncharacterized protein n=1 Tax=Mycena metata TaxID=1033252 RepID=A0AAD7KAC2_9AGAR|nr:hypothetical protein B0H16DRAFT_1448017 [Mycena metata]
MSLIVQGFGGNNRLATFILLFVLPLSFHSPSHPNNSSKIIHPYTMGMSEDTPKRFVLHERNLLDPSGKKHANSGKLQVDCLNLMELNKPFSLACSPNRDPVGAFIHGGDSGMTNMEGSDDSMPPIAFLREPTQSASPEFRPRNIPDDNPPKAKTMQSSHSLPPGPFTFTTQSAPPPSSAPPSRAILTPAQPSSKPLRVSSVPIQAPMRSSSVARDALPRRPKDATARTRAATGASAHEPAPRYKYTYNSLMRRPSDTHAPPRGADYGAPARQRELDLVCELTPAPVGTLGRKLEADEPVIAAMLFERLQDRKVDAVGPGAFAPWPKWIEPRPMTAPTATYAAILMETFGPGSILRGEGAKPQLLNKQRKSVTVQSSKGSRGTSASTSDLDVEMDVDTDESAGDDVSAEGVQKRARDWIAEIQMVVKGKRHLTREDLGTLSTTLKQIQNMDVAEGRALGEEGVRLQHSLRQLVQLDPEDIPFRDEHRVRRHARYLLKAWPTTT